MGETGEAAAEVSDAFPSIEPSSPPRSPPSNLDQLNFVPLFQAATLGEPKAERFPTAFNRLSRPQPEMVSIPSGERAKSRMDSTGKDRARRVRDGIGSRFGRSGRRRREERTSDKQAEDGSARRRESVSMRGGMFGCFLSVGVGDRLERALVIREIAEDRLSWARRSEVNE